MEFYRLIYIVYEGLIEHATIASVCGVSLT